MCRCRVQGAQIDDVKPAHTRHVVVDDVTCSVCSCKWKIHCEICVRRVQRTQMNVTIENTRATYEKAQKNIKENTNERHNSTRTTY